MTVLRVGRTPEAYSAKATYFDGTSARPAEIALSIDEDAKTLVGFTDAGTELRWPLTDIRETPEFLEIAEALEAAVGPVEVVLGHNDLLPANLLDAGDRMWLIDWDYGGLNSPLFDLAGLASNAGLDAAQERGLLADYYGKPADDALWRGYAAMKCGSLLRETMWSMVSEITSAPMARAWASIRTIRSGPCTSVSPGQFSTSVVVVSWPPGSSPCTSSGSRACPSKGT